MDAHASHLQLWLAVFAAAPLVLVSIVPEQHYA